MKTEMKFVNREEFREWLCENCLLDEGIWLIFEKGKEAKTLSAQEALEEALCFGWIDGQMKKIDDCSYRKYFSKRRKNSKWSSKNKDLVKALEEKGLMSDFGRKKIEEAKANGQWDAPKQSSVTKEQIEQLTLILKEYETAFINFQAMSDSVKKTYTKAFFDAKTEAGKIKRIAWIVDRLNQNLKPM